MTLSANAGIPAGLRRKPALDAAVLGGAKGHAAGVLFVAPDGDVLMLRRSGDEPNFAGHWALPGGGVEEGETPQIGAAREAKEEMGFDVDPGGFKLLDQRITPTGKAFHTFAKPVAEKFVPKLNGEHSGYAWAPLDMLPRPLHPAVEQTLKDRVGMADDMKPEDWAGLREGFLKWTAEEEAEPEHIASDSALLMALDRDSVREPDTVGRMRVAVTNISKATVNPYRGKEIPDAKALGLDPSQIYYLLRDPEELRKAAPSFNGVQLLKKHTPVSADDHKPYDVVGTTGTDCVFEDPYLKNSLIVWAKDAIGDIESDAKKELSCGYTYRADMTPGIFNGMRFDGVMRDISGNHVALVKDGRAGPDVVVGDSRENLMSKPTRLAAVTLGLVASAIAPLMAMDAKIELPKDEFAKLTSKTFKSAKPQLLASVSKALTGKLRPGMALDASSERVKTVLDALEGMAEGMDNEASEKETKEMESAANGVSGMLPKVETAEKDKAFDAEPFKAFLREKGMGEDDIAKACDMMPKAMAGDESDEEKKKKEEAEKKAAADKAAKDAEMKNMVTKDEMKGAMDAAIKTTRETERGIRAALDVVRPYVGELPATMAFDSGDDVYRHAAVTLGVPNAKTIHASALPTLITMMKKPGAQPVEHRMAMDSETVKDFESRFPGANRIQPA